MSKIKKKNNPFDIFGGIETQHNKLKIKLYEQKNQIREHAPKLDISLERDFDDLFDSKKDSEVLPSIPVTTKDPLADDSILSVFPEFSTNIEEIIEEPQTTILPSRPRRSLRKQTASVDLTNSPLYNTAIEKSTRKTRRRGHRTSKKTAICETITIGSDGEDPSGLPLFADSINIAENISKLSFDNINPEISVKVNWKGNIQTFKLRKYQKFSSLFEQLAQREKTTPSKIFLNMNDHIITPDDTLDNINYKLFNFIDGRVIDSNRNSSHSSTHTKKPNKNNLTFKVQSDKFKRPITVSLQRSDPLKVLFVKCAEELNLPYDKIKLSFDGELLHHTMTVTETDLEGGEILDLIL